MLFRRLALGPVLLAGALLISGPVGCGDKKKEGEGAEPKAVEKAEGEGDKAEEKKADEKTAEGDDKAAAKADEPAGDEAGDEAGDDKAAEPAAAEGDSCTQLKACCNDLQKMAPQMAGMCEPLEKQLAALPKAQAAMACDTAFSAMSKQMGAVPNVPDSCKAGAAAAGGGDKAAADDGKAGAVDTAGLSPLCTRVMQCCNDVKKIAPGMGQACDQLGQMLKVAGKGQADTACNMFFGQLQKATKGNEAMLPDSCKGDAAGTDAGAAGAAAAADGKAAAGGAEACEKAKACCGKMAEAMPQLKASCDQVDQVAKMGPQMCGQLLTGLQNAAKSLEAAGKPVPEECK